MKQLKHPPPTNEELTKETIDAVTTAFNHLKRFFNVFDAELDDVIEKALVEQKSNRKATRLKDDLPTIAPLDTSCQMIGLTKNIEKPLTA